MINISRGKVPGGLKVVIYGPEGIGKTTLAAQFPCPVFIDTEGSTKHMDVMRVDKPKSFAMLVAQAEYFRDNPEACQTLVLDTADWAEQLCMAAICAQHEKNGIEDFGYGKGYVYLREEFGKLLNILGTAAERGVNIVITAHAKMRKFEQPDEMGAYDRWELKLDKNTAPLVKEWADMVLFVNYKTTVINVDGKGTTKGKNKVQGGRRVMHATHNPCWDAKNRHGLPDEMPLDYAAIAHCVYNREQIAPSITPPPQQSPPRTPTPPAPTLQAPPEPDTTPPPLPPTQSAPPAEFEGIPPALQELLLASGVTVKEIQRAVASKGYFPANMPVSKYPEDFINNALIGTWDRVYGMVIDLRTQDAANASKDAAIIQNSGDMPF